MPVIASLNGGDAGGWPAYAHALQQAGASAIELNIYEIPAEAADRRAPSRTGTSRSSRP